MMKSSEIVLTGAIAVALITRNNSPHGSLPLPATPFLLYIYKCLISYLCVTMQSPNPRGKYDS